jgi:hypothetical protein
MPVAAGAIVSDAARAAFSERPSGDRAAAPPASRRAGPVRAAAPRGDPNVSREGMVSNKPLRVKSAGDGRAALPFPRTAWQARPGCAPKSPRLDRNPVRAGDTSMSERESSRPSSRRLPSDVLWMSLRSASKQLAGVARNSARQPGTTRARPASEAAEGTKSPTKPLFENLPSEKKRTVNLFLPSLLWANSQQRRLLASGACPMISCAASCRTGERGS